MIFDRDRIQRDFHLLTPGNSASINASRDGYSFCDCCIILLAACSSLKVPRSFSALHQPADQMNMPSKPLYEALLKLWHSTEPNADAWGTSCHVNIEPELELVRSHPPTRSASTSYYYHLVHVSSYDLAEWHEKELL